MRRHLLAALATVATASLCLTGCGGSDNAGTGGQTPVKVALLGTFSGPVASNLPTAKAVVEAWQKYINDKGGLDGHPVDLTVKDTAGVTGTNVTAAKQAISEGAVAILDFDNDLQWVKLADQAGVPVVSATSTGAMVSKRTFPVVNSPSAQTLQILQAARTFGPKFAMAYAAEAPVAAQYAQQMAALGQTLGVSVAVSAKVSSSQPDYTAFCQSVKASGAQSYFVGLSTEIAKKVTDQCYQQGLRIPQVIFGGQTPRSWVSDPAYQGSVTQDVIAPFFDTDIPGVAKYRDAMEKYLPNLPGSEDDASTGAQGWALTQMLEYAVQHGDGVTRDDIFTGLYTAKDETLNGLIAPVTYVEGETTHVNCGFLWKIDNNTFAPGPDGTKPTCAEPSQVEALDNKIIASLGGG